MSYPNNSFDDQPNQNIINEHSANKELNLSTYHLPTSSMQQSNEQSSHHQLYDISIKQPDNASSPDDNSYFSLNCLLNKCHGQCNDDLYLSRHVREFYKEQDTLNIDDYEPVHNGRNRLGSKKKHEPIPPLASDDEYLVHSFVLIVFRSSIN
jgi:hypothetical protein